MNKVYVLAPGEDWIVDRFVKEWNVDNVDINASSPLEAEVIWLLADWAWAQVPYYLLNDKKVLTTIHHIVPEKFGALQLQDFMARDAVTSAYHVPNKHTEAFIRPLTKRPIHVIPYWANQRIWRPTGTKGDLRKKHGLPVDGYLVGSFQRDTEGAGIPNGTFLPKLEKGPDLLCNWLDGMQGYADGTHNAHLPLHVVLAGWRRQYVIERLKKRGVAYTYFELPSQEVLNELYQTLDLYPVASRYEGGPQSLIECGLLGIPCISRDVGIASVVLPRQSINDDLLANLHTVPNVEALKLPGGYQPYRDLIASL